MVVSMNFLKHLLFGLMKGGLFNASLCILFTHRYILFIHLTITSHQDYDKNSPNLKDPPIY